MDEFIPAPPQARGRTQRFVDELREHPGEWRLYPYPVERPRQLRTQYPSAYPGTEWALDDEGRLGARWVGIDDDKGAA